MNGQGARCSCAQLKGNARERKRAVRAVASCNEGAQLGIGGRVIRIERQECAVRIRAHARATAGDECQNHGE
jgi:hypothetical protein